jgi:hypothetical protein
MIAKRQAEILLNELMEIAEQMLTELGEFLPFGGTANAAGETQHVTVFDDGDSDDPSELEHLLLADLRERAQHAECALVAAITNVSVTDPDSGLTVDAVHAAVEHRERYAVDAYFPYRLDDGTLEYGETVTRERTRTIFADA